LVSEFVVAFAGSPLAVRALLAHSSARRARQRMGNPPAGSRAGLPCGTRELEATGRDVVLEVLELVRPRLALPVLGRGAKDPAHPWPQRLSRKKTRERMRRSEDVCRAFAGLRVS